jgi:hypothetical protein
MAISDTDLRRVRAEVGTSPDDDAVADAWTDAEADGIAEDVRWAAVAAQILGARLADQVAGTTSVAIAGAISVSTSTTNIPGLTAQVARLRGIAGVGGGVTGGVLTRASSRSRLDAPTWPPRI